MIVRPQLQALRDDNTPQRRAQAALAGQLAAWRRGRTGAGLADAMQAYSRGAALAELPPLARLFEPDSNAAGRLAENFVRPFTAILAELHWGQVPIPNRLDAAIATLILASSGGATLALQAIDGSALACQPRRESASFSPGEAHDRVLAGAGQGRLVTFGGKGAPVSADCALSPGDVLNRDSAAQALLIDRAEGTLVMLKLQRRPPSGTAVREYRLTDGALLHQAAASAHESRLELAAALLGRMGRRDAAPLLAAMAEEHGSASLRWQAVKEALGLDSAAGFGAVRRIAGRADDPLAPSAAALQAQLLQSYPYLARIA